MLASDHGASTARRSLLGNGRQSVPALSGLDSVEDTSGSEREARLIGCRWPPDRLLAANCGHWTSRFDLHLADVRGSVGVRFAQNNQGETHANT
jgi:hypothetical protein